MKFKKEVAVRVSVAVLSISSLIAFFKIPYTDVKDYDKLCPPECNTVFINCDDTQSNLKFTYSYDTLFTFMASDDIDVIVFNSDELTDKEARSLYYKNNKEY